MEKQPQFIRDFSKEESPQERQQTAKAIKANRAEHFTGRVEQRGRQSELQQSTTERERISAEKLETIRTLETEIVELSNSGLDKICNFFELWKLRADLTAEQRTIEELQEQQYTEVKEKHAISNQLETGTSEVQGMLKDFYKGQKEKWATSEYTKEDIEKYFAEEHLASLSIEDYVTLLRRFPGEMVTHVTRQGIRDHTGHLGHIAGVGAYADGFMKMVDDGRLRSPFGVCLVEREKDKAIADFLHLDKMKGQEQAMGYLNNFTTSDQGKPGSGDYADRTAVHFATEEVADCFYGAEVGNEIFVAYPSAYIASQYYFHGQLNQKHNDRPHDAWNDQWVWANEERGMDLNAGIIFIPAEARVDKKNGSQYELDGNLNRIKKAEDCATLRKLLDSVDFDDLAKKVSELTKGTQSYYGFYDIPKTYKRELMKSVEPLCQKLEQEFGTISRDVFFIFFHNLSDFSRVTKDEREGGKPGYMPSIDESIEETLKKAGLLYLRAKDTISSEEFWEAYFKKNPSKRPSKIVYYRGLDPTFALSAWRYGKHIDKKSTDKNIGFPENSIGSDDMAKVTVGMDRFKTLALKVIEDYFAEERSTAA